MQRGVAWLGMAWHGLAWRGMAWRGVPTAKNSGRMTDTNEWVWQTTSTPTFMQDHALTASGGCGSSPRTLHALQLKLVGLLLAPVLFRQRCVRLDMDTTEATPRVCTCVLSVVCVKKRN